MTTVQRPSFEVAHSLGSILWRDARGRYEIRLRDRPNEPQRSTYVAGPRTAARYAVAERELAERIHRTSRGERTIGRSLTVGRWLDEWLEIVEPGLKPATVLAYRTRIRLYLKPVLGSARLHELEATDVTRAMLRIRQLPGERTAHVSAGTADAAYRVLNAALAYAFDHGRAPRNACRGSSHERSSTVIEPPTRAELDRLCAELVGHPWQAVIEIMRWTGARHGEILGLTWRAVDLDTGRLGLVRQARGSMKTHRSVRYVFAPPHVVELLRQVPRRLGSDLVFSTSSGRPLDERNVLRVFDAACERAGIAPHLEADLVKYRPHDLRHAFATMLLEASVAPHVVARWLGHASLSMLDRYAHVAPMPGGDAARLLVAVYGPELAAGFGIRARDAIAL